MMTALRDKYPINSLTHQAYDSIRSTIVAGTLKPGDPLDERTITGKLKLSRTPAREALVRLEAEGLVESVPRVGMFVRKLDRRERRELMELRGALEAASAAMAAQRIAPAQAEELNTIAEEIDACPFSSDPERNRHLETTFHHYVCSIAGNSEIIRLLHQTHALYLTLFSDDGEGRPSFQEENSTDSHRRLAKEIVGGNPMRAYQVMWEHFGLSDSQRNSAIGHSQEC